ncbi:putative spindle pole body component alp14 protein [Phaeoacremonium minimum UCRPA7]|uniref:Putative spindle pole body component alp14 protein n=1 Tax=Phaeoacremonium minimum (strain UCR-PA7) TaxID=1286976 RepID=R8B8X6_PHAM7|nr:putative spindle pole body component alp14 protein [Phaeoacremonium minimum UCRPA7]EON95732.1 putative spindle pole body component alp14 protein [Phaeoacremonium minimum UCRPA7]
MAEQEEDYSSLPLTDRFTHKVWKVRKQAYEEAAKIFEATPDEHDNAFRPFLMDPGMWKGAVADSNVAAQQDGIAALCAFLKFGGKENCTRTRGSTVTPIVEKGLSSTRAATKASALEALLLYIELDVPGPIIEDILPVLSAKQPKVVAAALAALTTIFHNYGCKIADPKPVLKILPKVFGHADKNVRAEATNLAVEFYRWLREAMKPMFWGDLKPTQQSDLEAQFEKIKAEAPPKQERLLRTQQAAQARAPAAGAAADEDEGEDFAEEPAEIDAFDLAEPQNVLSKVPADFHDNLASSKWKERKEALEALYAILNVPRIKDGDFGEINRGLAKCMKDANIAVVTQAAQCIEVLAKGLRKSYGKYRSIVMQPIMERLKEKKQSVADALGAALDQVFLATSLSECLEDIVSFLTHKNPQIKEGSMKFLVRCLRTTRDVPAKAEISQIVESAKKLLSESSEGLRSGGAEILGTVMKIIGERAMNPHLEGLDDIRKTKVKEFYETAEVKAKDKPKPAPAPAARGPPGGPRKVVGGGGVKKAPIGVKKAAPVAAAPPPAAEPLAPQPTSRSAPGSKLGMPKPSGLGGLKAPQKRTLPGPGGASPRRPLSVAPPAPVEEEPAPPQPRLGMARGGLAARSLAKPATASSFQPPQPASPTPSSGLTALERAELEELRAANDRLTRQAEEFRHERSKLLSEIQELKNQNAGLIEDHTRDVLSIKAKETQLVRARSDAEAAEGTNDRLRRELDRLKRALSKAEALGVSQGGLGSPGSAGFASPTHDDVGIFRDGGAAGYRPASANRNRMSYTSTLSEEKENGEAPPSYPRSKLSPELRYAGSAASSGRGSPARGFRRPVDVGGDDGAAAGPGPTSSASNMGSGGGNGVESWKRAAEVTNQLKARIEQMKAKQGFARQ